ncbi:hypothetical protein A3D78_03190 [Candidatus Gottesmanbacteria bacterium RIFCSPHIGHO2_02_FULL_39_14]|uniref:Uncharacterized protein n=2 Tax=Candidatus Gottesmaniibacteriota TaxID=1752720 RepID=A0A1F5ZYN5_9BACT|nr:MAG: hypothetical protein A3D78_03190 [Candidatus Gottesmanbacteria bacterium RIFCSPHIGHO2_02_FULL_39_14]OGG30826.1 MAG: hypothetical protein A3I51_03415 [Candidatus Gottesmanbacteria bacterium RIFCSPLOWO2_02_FULL_38_8]
MDQGEGPPKPRRVARRDFLKIASGGVVGVVADEIARKFRKEKKGDEQPPIVATEVPMINLPLKVESGVKQTDPSIDPKLRETLISDENPSMFLEGGALISALMIEKYLDGSLTVEQIRAITQAMLMLKGIQLPDFPDETPPEGTKDTAISSFKSSIKST